MSVQFFRAEGGTTLLPRSVGLPCSSLDYAARGAVESAIRS